MEKETESALQMAQQILGELLRLMGIEANIIPSNDFPVDAGDGIVDFPSLNIEGEDLGILIGRRGQTLASLQYMVRLILSQRMDEKIPVIVDVEGYKRRRYESLRVLANRIAEQVRTRKRPFTLEPMPAFERRIIHMTLAGHPDIVTESTGAGEARKVVVANRKGY